MIFYEIVGDFIINYIFVNILTSLLIIVIRLILSPSRIAYFLPIKYMSKTFRGI